MTARMDWETGPARALSGTLAIPGDKSVSHRAVMLAALADGTSTIDGFLEAADTRATAAIMASLGVGIDTPGPGRRVVHGVGLNGLTAPADVLDCGNSGTGMRLLAGLLVGQHFDSVLTGDASLRRRPMARIADPLAVMGAGITMTDGCAPLRITGGHALAGIDYLPPVASAQVKSAVLLAGLYAEGSTCVTEKRPTRDYTERMLQAFGWPVECQPGRASVTGSHRLRACDVTVPRDFSSAAFFIVAASLVPGSELYLSDVGINPRRTGLLRVLELMGADIRLANRRELAGEPLADLQVRHAPLQGIDVPPDAVSDMIDEFPVLFVAAAAANGTTRVRGAAELRVKESDRIAAMASGLRALGVAVTEHPDGADIKGRPQGFDGGHIDSHEDHRIAMAFAVAGALAKDPVTIRDCGNVGTSFPGFDDLARQSGLGLQSVA